MSARAFRYSSYAFGFDERASDAARRPLHAELLVQRRHGRVETSSMSLSRSPRLPSTESAHTL